MAIPWPRQPTGRTVSEERGTTPRTRPTPDGPASGQFTAAFAAACSTESIAESFGQCAPLRRGSRNRVGTAQHRPAAPPAWRHATSRNVLTSNEDAHYREPSHPGLGVASADGVRIVISAPHTTGWRCPVLANLGAPSPPQRLIRPQKRREQLRWIAHKWVSS